ncbi:MAG: hypothetical protein ACKV2V_16505 [Blastocatellia bacterium]
MGTSPSAFAVPVLNPALSSRDGQTEQVGILCRLLDHEARALTASALQRMLHPSLRLPLAELSALLASMSARGLIHHDHKHNHKGGSPVFWSEAVDQRTRDALRHKLRAGPASQKALLAATDAPPALARLVLQAMISEGLAHAWPPPKGTAPWVGLTPPDPRLYLETPVAALRKSMDRVTRRLAAAGVTNAQVTAAVRAMLQGDAVDAQARDNDALAAIILDRLPHLDTAAVNGALVSTRALLDVLRGDGYAPEHISRAVLDLYKKGHVVLTRHHHPAILSATDRAAMIQGPDGACYNGVALVVPEGINLVR